MGYHLWYLLWSGPPLSRLKKRTSGYIFNFLGFCGSILVTVHVGVFKHQKSPFPCLRRGMPLLDGEMRCTRTTNITSKQLNLMVWGVAVPGCIKHTTSKNHPESILLMVQKSGIHQLRLVDYPITHQGFLIQTVVVWDFFHQQWMSQPNSSPSIM